MAGICNTDIELFGGYYGFEGIAGHEFVGIVEEAPEGTELVGKRVVADINCGCGQCSWCVNGNASHCPLRTVIGILGRQGAFAEYVPVPLENLHIVDDSIRTQEAVFAEPLAAALRIRPQIHLTHRSRVAVLGDGKLGLLVALALRHHCPRLLLCGRYPGKLKIAADQGVETRAINPRADRARLRRELGCFDVVIEATGSADGINQAVALTRPEGTVVAKTTSHHPSELDLATIVVKEVTVIGSRCGDLDLALSFLRNGWIDVNPLVERIYKFTDFERAFAHACRRGSKKVLLSFD
jgi:threonine dehydrogenase-like Zn-dependent dehydrogenase